VIITSLLSLTAIEVAATGITNQMALASSNFTQISTNLTNGLLQNGITLQTRDISPEDAVTRTNQTTTVLTGNQTTVEALPLPPLLGRHYVPIQGAIARGYFGLGDWEVAVHVTSTSDFLTCIWARNVETFLGGVQVLTPPSQFRTAGSSGPFDGLVLDVPSQTGMDLGCIGAQSGEVIEISSARGARVVVYLTAITAEGATVNMVGIPRP
jgi:hypothetical protein